MDSFPKELDRRSLNIGALRFSSADCGCYLTQANHAMDEQAVVKTPNISTLCHLIMWCLLTQTKLQSCLQCIIKGFGCTPAKCHSSMLDSSNNYNWSIICKVRSLCELFCPAVLRHCTVQSNYSGIPKPQSLIPLFDRKGCQDSEGWSDLSRVTLLVHGIVYGLDSRNSYALIWCSSLNVVTTRNDFIVFVHRLQSFLVTLSRTTSFQQLRLSFRCLKKKKRTIFEGR